MSFRIFVVSGVVAGGLLAATHGMAAGVDPQLVAKGLAKPAKQPDADYDKIDPAKPRNAAVPTRRGMGFVDF